MPYHHAIYTVETTFLLHASWAASSYHAHCCCSCRLLSHHPLSCCLFSLSQSGSVSLSLRISLPFAHEMTGSRGTGTGTGSGRETETETGRIWRWGRVLGAGGWEENRELEGMGLTSLSLLSLLSLSSLILFSHPSIPSHILTLSTSNVALAFLDAHIFPPIMSSLGHTLGLVPANLPFTWVDLPLRFSFSLAALCPLLHLVPLPLPFVPCSLGPLE